MNSGGLPRRPWCSAREIEGLLQGAGFTQARTETLDLGPPVVCVLAVNPDPLTASRSSVT